MLHSCIKSDDYLFEAFINDVSPKIINKTLHLRKPHIIRNKVHIENCQIYYSYKGIIKFSIGSQFTLINNCFYGTQKNNTRRANVRRKKLHS